MSGGVEKARREQRRAESLACAVHAFQRHGKEAQELRSGIETIVSGMSASADELSGDDARDQLVGARRALEKLLDDVDARDSLAYLERCVPGPSPMLVRHLDPKRLVKAYGRARGRK